MTAQLQSICYGPGGLIEVRYTVGDRTEVQRMHPDVFWTITSFCYPEVIQAPVKEESPRVLLDRAGLNRG